jgi:hypothetical protein
LEEDLIFLFSFENFLKIEGEGGGKNCFVLHLDCWFYLRSLLEDFQRRHLLLRILGLGARRQ